jgi:peptidoglycan/LPS O-acetylase OafA/YrhL
VANPGAYPPATLDLGDVLMASSHTSVARLRADSTVAAVRASNTAAAPRVSGIAYDDGAFSLGLGALRGFAALGVVIHHVSLALPIGRVRVPYLERVDVSDGSLLAQHVFLGFFNGMGLVTLFFVLSGCVLAMSLDRVRDFELHRVPGYWVRRGFRLYPLLFLAATLGALLQVSVNSGELASASAWANWHYEVPTAEVPREWALNAIGYSNSLNSPAWSIKVELLASFIFPALYVLTLRPSLAAPAAVFLIFIMFGWPGPGIAYMQIFAFSFFVGALVPRYGAVLVGWYSRQERLWKRVIAIAVLLSFMYARRIIDPQTTSPAVILVESLCAAFIVSFVLVRPASPLIRSAIVQWLGRISYGIYLFHLIVLFALLHLLLPILPVEGTAARVLMMVFLGVATLLITLPLASVLYSAFEHPLQRLGSRAARAFELPRGSRCHTSAVAKVD